MARFHGTEHHLCWRSSVITSRKVTSNVDIFHVDIESWRLNYKRIFSFDRTSLLLSGRQTTEITLLEKYVHLVSFRGHSLPRKNQV